MNTEIEHKARDIIQKHASGLFKDSALEFYGIKSAKIKELVNVELPVVKVVDSSTDYIFLLEDASYLHLEFQTTNAKKDLARFAAYDVRLYERDEKKVTTVIIYSSEVKEAETYLEIGSIIYNPQKIMMNDYNGNEIYEKLENKIKNREDLTDVDLMNLIFLPLMKHTLSKAELATKTVELAQTISDETKRDICIASAVAFASKYLNDSEKRKLMEVIRMADLIDMIVEESVEKGKLEGKLETAQNALLKGFSIDDIMAITGLAADRIKELQQEVIPN